MAEVSNKQNVEYVDGPRNSNLLFYNNQLYSKHSDYWKCRQCSKLLKLNNKEEVTIEPKHEHLEEYNENYSFRIWVNIWC